MPRLARRLSLLLWMALAAAPAFGQTVRDSVKMTRGVYSWYQTNSLGGIDCGAYVYAVWPDVLAELGLPGGYGRYSRVAVGGTPAHYVPTGYGQATNDPSRNLIVPEGYLGHAPQLGGHGSGPVDNGGCADNLARVQGYVGGGAMSVLNARPFQITDWYAVFSIPSGTPMALFTWDQRRGLDVAFDGSFESTQSREVDATAPGGKRPVASYAWDFGDGTTGSGARPAHTYDSTGTYTVTLTVTDDDGQTARHAETIEVKGGVLSVRVHVEPTERNAGDTLTVVATVTNTGTDAVTDVVAQRVFAHSETYPSAANVPGDRFQEPTLERVGEAAPVQIALLDPNDSFEVRARYLVKTVGKYQPTGTTGYEPIETDVRSALSNVSARTPGGASARVVDDCAATACDNVWRVVPEVLSFEIAFKAAPRDGLVEAEVTAVPSGLTAGPSGVVSVLARHRVRTADLSDQVCRSGCAEVEVTVTDEHGQPAEGVEVSLRAPLVPITLSSGFGAVTSGQRGRFCNFDADATGTLCGNPLRGVTDAEGRLRRTYLTPGVVSDVPVEITAEPQDANVAGKATRTLTVQPNVVRETTIDVNDDASRALMAALGVRGFTGLAELPANFCKGVGGFLGSTATLLAPRLQQLPYLEGVSTNALEWACGKLPNHPIAEVLAQGKPMAELIPLTWLLESTQLPSIGLASVTWSVNSPFVKVEDDFTPHVSDALAAIARANSAPISPYSLLRGSVPVRIVEVSYLTDTSTDGAGTEKSTYGLYLDIGGQAKLVRAGYDGRFWLQEGALDTMRPALGGAASAGDTEIDVAPPSPAPARAAGQAGLTASGAGRAAADTVRAGDLVALGTGDANAEVVQVWSVTGTTLRLTTPLRYTHAAGEALHVLGQRAPEAPDRPLAYAPADSASATARPLLQWASLVPAASYDVQISRDTTFAALVQEHPAVTADSLRLDGLAEGNRYAWRVRARNAIGVGPWSRPATFVAATPVAAESAPGVQASMELVEPHPNPSRTTASVAFGLPVAADVRLSVFDVLGREVAVLVDERRSAGAHAVTLATEALSPGVYVVRLVAGREVQSRRLVVTR